MRNVNSMALVTSSMALFSMFDDKSRQFYMAVSGSKRKAKSFKDDEYFILCESVSMGRKLTSIQSVCLYL
nr:hypothetical protein Iba_chr02fCG6650 [Ipomoea batatas]